jgi:hypothetical protein
LSVQIISGGNAKFGSYVGSSLQILAGGSIEANLIFILDQLFFKVTPNDEVLPIELSNGNPINIDLNKPYIDIRAGLELKALEDIWLESNFEKILPRSLDFIKSSLSQTTTHNLATSSKIDVNALAINPLKPERQGFVVLTNKYRPNLLLNGDSQININDINKGNLLSSSIVIDFRGKVNINGVLKASALDSSLLFPDRYSENSFITKGGDAIIIADKDLTFFRGSSLISEGSLGGNIILKSHENVIIDNNLIGKNTQLSLKNNSIVIVNQSFNKDPNQAELTGGNLSISGNSIFVEAGANLGVALGENALANAGNLTFDARDVVEFDGKNSEGITSSTFTRVEFGAIGNAGGIEINTGSLLVSNGFF